MLYLSHATIHDDAPADSELKAVKSQCGLRRADRFTVLAAAAVKNAFPQTFPNGLPADTALVTVSAFGPHKTVFATLDDILDYPEDQILPTKFSHSVHNAAASYLGTILHLTGPAFAVTGFENPLGEALALAQTLLDARLCSTLLLVAVEERGLLTAHAPELWPERFPVEPAEATAVFLAHTSPAPDTFTLTFERPGTPATASHGSPFGLPADLIRQLNDHQNTTLTL